MTTMTDFNLESCARAVDEASSLPPACYTSDAIAKAEIDTVFRGGWMGVGRSDMVTNPGDFITLDIAGQNIILLRDRQGQLRAHANSCRHRGARLVNGEGSCKGLRCPFHSWFYGPDGQLVAAPHMERGMIEFGNDQLKSAAERRDPREMLANSADSSVAFVQKLSANAQDAWKVQSELRDELVQLFEDQMKQFGNVSTDEGAGDAS